MPEVAKFLKSFGTVQYFIVVFRKKIFFLVSCSLRYWWVWWMLPYSNYTQKSRLGHSPHVEKLYWYKNISVTFWLQNKLLVSVQNATLVTVEWFKRLLAFLQCINAPFCKKSQAVLAAISDMKSWKLKDRGISEWRRYCSHFHDIVNTST